MQVLDTDIDLLSNKIKYPNFLLYQCLPLPNISPTVIFEFEFDLYFEMNQIPNKLKHENN